MAKNRYTIWLVSPYHTGSHAVWAAGYQRYSLHNVHLVTMAGRFWKWRMQGGAMELAVLAQEKLKNDGPPEIILTTDMVNLPAWLGLLRSQLPRTIPVLHYMHENQLTYPWQPGEKPDLTYAMINWLSQLTANQVIFNSHYHMDAWFSELPRLLKHFPDYNHLDLIDVVHRKSVVLPVGIDCDLLQQNEQLIDKRGVSRRLVQSRVVKGQVASSPDKLCSGCRGRNDDQGHKHREMDDEKDSKREKKRPLIIWNHRWEYDKGPKAFFNCLYRLQDMGVDFDLAVAGENFRNVPIEFEQARERLAGRIVHWGYVDSYATYVGLLQQADLVMSTALHEFFGISILEAIVAGAFPLLPNRLSYPELIPAALHPACLYNDEEELVQMSLQRIQMPRPAPPSLREHLLAHYNWPVVAAQYDALMEELLLDN